MGVGKSTLARSLCDTLALPRCSIDEIQWVYLAETDFDHAKARTLLRTNLDQFRDYTNPFLVSVVERAITEHPDHVIDFGAGHTAYDDPAHVERIKSVLEPIQRVLLLMPSPDVEVCLELLPGPLDGMRMNPIFIKHPLKDELAKHVIYTYGTSAADVVVETLRWLRGLNA